MLARPEITRCIECGLAYGSPGFALDGDGPAYWCDRGVLCSPRCSLAHHKMRTAEGTLPARPAPDPFG
ncbi:hypothetical protein [Mesorhizobium sp. Z1-4]|uniref:hypothetical protein n=1 Tax=Mesorhizobium sp. Z1-4 TaxID=2448478 RepID=UPI000FD98C34|nr:hypothetical protein [Mesorhizobium sp. Z1-4]